MEIFRKAMHIPPTNQPQTPFSDKENAPLTATTPNAPQSPAPFRILLMSAGSLVAHNVLDCLARHDRRYFLIGTNTVPDAPGNFRCDVAFTTPPTDDAGACLAAYRAILATERPDLTIPCRDEDLPILAALRAENGDAPGFLCGDAASADLFTDKLAVHRFAVAHNLPFAPTAHDGETAAALAAAYGFPLIAKPRRGAGSRGVALLRDAGDVDRAVAAGGYVFQPFIAPPADWSAVLRPFDIGVPFQFAVPVPDQYTGQAFIAADGAVVGAFCSVVAMDAGKVAAARRIDCPDFLALTRAFATAAAAEGHRGPLNVQCRKTTDGAYVPIEMNGRYSGSTSIRGLQGYDEVDMAVRLTAGLPPAAPETGRVYPVAVKMPGDAVIPDADADVLRRNGVWRKDAASPDAA